MSQEDYIKQIEEENACLKRKLDEALLRYDEIYNSEDNLYKRLDYIKSQKAMSRVEAFYSQRCTKEQLYRMGRERGLQDKEIEDIIKEVVGYDD